MNVKNKSKGNDLIDLENTMQACKKLMNTPYYKKMGEEGIFAILSTSQSLGIDPRTALGGSLYYAKGKVEMKAQTMNALIRSKKHSITRDKSSNEKICILHGKRSDTGDCWTESFSIEEAQKAGLLRNEVWRIYPKDMLFARALSRLARQLFPDVIGNCYVEGEISLMVDTTTSEDVLISSEKVKEISSFTSKLDDKSFEGFLSYYGINKVQDLKESQFEDVRKNLIKKLEPKEIESDDNRKDVDESSAL